MTARPEWALAVHRHLTDTVVGGLPEDGSEDELLDKIIDAMNDVLCGHFGHAIVDDQCGIPAHRFCAWCNRRESEL